MQTDMQISTTGDRRPTTILVLAGTRDGRDLAAALAAAGHQVLASAATPYGGELLRRMPGVQVREGRLDTDAMIELLKSGQVGGVLDATHPFATEVSGCARRAARECGIPYLRWERPPAELPDSPLVHVVSGWDEAAQRLAALGAKSIFLAVGVKPLPFILHHPALAGCRFTARVLPVPESLSACRDLGLDPDQIIACQGPGTIRLNEALLEACSAEAFLIKESGGEGGTALKAQAALNLGIPVVVVERPGRRPPLVAPGRRPPRPPTGWVPGGCDPAPPERGADRSPEGKPARMGRQLEQVLAWAEELKKE
jgi:precorrin-6x reductase